MGKKKKKGDFKSRLIVLTDTVPMSMVKSQVLASLVNREEITSLVMFAKKADEKVLDDIDKKFVFFHLHSKYQVYNKNGEVLAPEYTDEKGFSTYKISFKQFLKTVAAELIQKDIWFMSHCGDEKMEKKAEERKNVEAIYAIDTTDKKDKEKNKKLYLWNLTQLVGEIRNKKKKKLAYIRFDL